MDQGLANVGGEHIENIEFWSAPGDTVETTAEPDKSLTIPGIHTIGELTIHLEG
jgi:hypothetical protein